MQRNKPLPRKRKKARAYKTPRCKTLRCNSPADIAELCMSHAMKRADAQFQGGVRDRDARCTGQGILPGECTPILQAAHIVGRTNYSVRYDPANCHALCTRHHILVDQHGREHFKYQWATALLGEEGYSRLMVRAQAGIKRRSAIAEQLGEAA